MFDENNKYIQLNVEEWRDLVVNNPLTAISAAYDLSLYCEDLREIIAYLHEQLRSVEEWKRSMLQVEAEWDPQAIASMLGGKLGESCHEVIMREVPYLIAERDAMLSELRMEE